MSFNVRVSAIHDLSSVQPQNFPKPRSPDLLFYFGPFIKFFTPKSVACKSSSSFVQFSLQLSSFSTPSRFPTGCQRLERTINLAENSPEKKSPN
ncbi:hypothetical protein L596_015631 [Steinernema carpocapsae]|uniref:Uncharacterized protein n=1 Tax=Steinernema carpocapsae TaxID=34508 RepID=A0A4U5NFK6_STECR|nr:hypothetical protein L596_015631 [Steinernema carpocapsae]